MSSAMQWPRPVRQALTVLICIALITGVVIGIREWINRPEAVLGDADTRVELSCLPSHTIQAFHNGLLYSDSSKVVYQPINPKDKEVGWEIAASQYNAGVGLLATWNQNLLSLYDATGTPLFLNKDCGGTINNVRCGTSYVAALIDNAFIQIYNTDGGLSPTVGLESETLLDFGFFGTDDTCWYSVIDTSGSEPIVQLKKTVPKKGTIGNTTAQNDQLLYKAIFNLDLSEIALIGTRQLRYYDHNFALIDSKPARQVYGWQFLDAHTAKDTTYALFAPYQQISSGDATLRTLRLIYDEQDAEIRLPTACHTIIAGKKAIYAISRDTLYRYAYPAKRTLPTGKPDATKRFALAIEGVHTLLNDDTLVVSSGGKVYLIPV